MKKSIIIYGFGRMGLTHYAILNQLIEADFTLVDLNKKVNFFAKKNVKGKLLNDVNKLQKRFDIAVVCTPPMFHVSTVESCLERGDKTIFVEKPFGGVDDDYSRIEKESDKVKIGYVMRFVPIIKWVKQNLPLDRVVKFEGSYFSNTIEKKPKGWRNGKYSGVSNEMGAHILDLAVSILKIEDFKIKDKEVKSVISDIDDIVSFNLEANNISCYFHFDWVNKNYRKPVLNLKIILDDGTYYKVDQQKIEVYDKNDKIIKKITTVDLAVSAPFYLRGVEFTHQMEDLINEQKTLASVEEALVTRKIIKKILD